MFYVYDTLPGADLEPYDPKQHRDHYANMTKRSRYFMVAPGKVNAPEETKGQAEAGYRFFEGAAAGAVLIGQAPEGPAFTDVFPWPDAVFRIAPDGSDVLDIISRLNANPDHMAEISCRNATESLLRHDWIYRWKDIFAAAGLTPSAGMADREARLHELASVVSGVRCQAL